MDCFSYLISLFIFLSTLVNNVAPYFTMPSCSTRCQGFSPLLGLPVVPVPVRTTTNPGVGKQRIQVLYISQLPCSNYYRTLLCFPVTPHLPVCSPFHESLVLLVILHWFYTCASPAHLLQGLQPIEHPHHQGLCLAGFTPADFQTMSIHFFSLLTFIQCYPTKYEFW